MNNLRRFIKFSVILAAVLAAVACKPSASQPLVPRDMKDVPANRLNYKLEADLAEPPPSAPSAADERNAAVQNDFQTRRPTEAVERTVVSPDKRHILVAYRASADTPDEFRLDLYDGEGKFIRTVSPATLAVIFPNKISWSPDNQTFAFTASRRVAADLSLPATAPNENTPNNAVVGFRTEQIYLGTADGELKPLTSREGLIYFHFEWAPNGGSLAALACREDEYENARQRAADNVSPFQPYGRVRVIEKNGRERLLDDSLTPVLPQWSPDSTKIASAVGYDVRVYDAAFDAPTLAALPLRVPLLTASQKFDETHRQKLASETNANTETNSNANSNANANTSANSNNNVNANSNSAGITAENTDAQPISFAPIVRLIFADDRTIFVQTGFPNADETVTFNRWHKLDLSPQPLGSKTY